MNIIKNYVIIERNKDKFNEVVKQINQIQHETDFIFYDEEMPVHTITIKKKNYNIEFSYSENTTGKSISRGDTYFEIYGDYIDNPPQALQWSKTDDLWDYCCYASNDDDINHLKEMEREVINYFNTLKPMKRTIKIKK
jgi:hypothetical protein